MRVDELLEGLAYLWGYMEAKELKFGANAAFEAITEIKRLRTRKGLK